MDIAQNIVDILLSAAFWTAVLRIATPYVLGTLGELVCERAGVLNLGIEGIMTLGAMAGWMAVYQGVDLWTGVLVAAGCGALMGLLHATLTVPLGLSQHVTGIGITLLGTSLSYYVYRLVLPQASTPPSVPCPGGRPNSGPRSCGSKASCWRFSASMGRITAIGVPAPAVSTSSSGS